MLSPYQDIVQAALAITGSHMANFQLADCGELRIVAQHGFERDFLDFFAVVQDDDCACGVALKSLVPIVVEDVRSDPIFAGKASRAAVLDAGALSVVSVPILERGGRLIGMLSTHRRTAGRPLPAKLKRLEWLSQQAGRIVEGTASPLMIRGIEMLARI